MKKVLFIGQAPPKKITDVPFGGTLLYKWLEAISITKEEAVNAFHFTALVSTFPGYKGTSHRAPSETEILADRPRLVTLIEGLRPDIIVTVGVLSARDILTNKDLLLHEVVGKKFTVQPFGNKTLPVVTIIPIPHPSGASTWIYQDDHKALLDSALHLLQEELAHE